MRHVEGAESSADRHGSDTTFDPSAVRAELGKQRGRALWQSLEELSSNRSFEGWVQRQHPGLLEAISDPIERRDVLRVLGASLGLAGLAACTRQPDERIVPFARNPEAIVPGVPLYFATAMPWSSGAVGLLVTSHMGRPTKIDGNPDHPGSRGGTDGFTQASILGMYDPDRSQSILRTGVIATWDSFLAELTPEVENLTSKQGAGLRILTPPVTSPTLAAQLQELLAQMPKARWHQYEPVGRDQSRAGALLAFGSDVVAHHDFERAKVVVALDSDFLGFGPSSVADVRAFARARRARSDKPEINRLYAVESSVSLTGAMADERVAVKPSQLADVVQALARALAVDFQPSGANEIPPKAAAWVQLAARDLAANKGASVVVAGEWAPPAVHALAHALNAALGNVGATVTYGDPVAVVPIEQAASISELVADMKSGAVDVLAIVSGNPVHDAPAELDFAQALAKVPFKVHLGLYEDETSGLCRWHLNETHYLESWSDARAADGTVAIVQPLIAPLYGGKSAHELVAALAGKPGVKPYDVLRDAYKQRLDGGDDAAVEKAWRKSLNDGVVAGTALPAKDVTAKRISLPPSPAPATGKLDVQFRPDGCAWDGRFVNNSWLQECPRVITKLVWDNAAVLAPSTAQKLGVENGDVLEIKHGTRALSAPVWISPGEAEDCITLTLGYGRKLAGKVGTGIGYDAYLLRTSDSPWLLRSPEVRKTGDHYELISAQMHSTLSAPWSPERTDIYKVVEAGHLALEHGHGPVHKEDKLPSLYKDFRYDGRAWAMVIDLNTCIGCNACTLACQAENNIPVVGKAQIKKNREMHWIRIDRYFEGDSPENPKVRFQPVPCMHCENAPCELVCPVGATVHGPEGLNEMVYNRCVGTKYCSNNCPYKVRRFNFLLYQDWTTEQLKLQRNPNVTVRSRGVMEKCTYCVQRISAARITAEKEQRPIRDGEVVTACQSVCPAEAIVFGDMNDPQSHVAKLKREPQHYGMLLELNTRPRTTYLAKVDNPARAS